MEHSWSYLDFVADALTRVEEVTCEALNELLPSKPALLDVREADEVESGRLPRAVHLPRGLLEKHVHEFIPQKETLIYVYCSTGKRSAMAADVLMRMGYVKAVNLAGGIVRWQELGLPLEGVTTSGVFKTPLPDEFDREDVSQAAEAAENSDEVNWQKLRQQYPIVGRTVSVMGAGTRPLVYLDHAASTQAPFVVLDSYRQFMEKGYANVHRGTHLLSRQATERFEEGYQVVAEFIGGELEQGCVCFTFNTTQAIDLAAHIIDHLPGIVVTTELEHHSNELPYRKRGKVLHARVTDKGGLDYQHLEELLGDHQVKLVAVSGGSNITGYLPDVHRVARLAHQYGALVLVDAAQALAHIPIDVKPFGDPEHLDFVAAAGHKAYAPFGCGFLYGPRGLMDEAAPYIPGGGTASHVTGEEVHFVKAPDRHQGGTPSIGGVVGLTSALHFLQSIGMEHIREHELGLLRKLIRELSELEGVRVYGDPDPEQRLGVVAFNIDGVNDLLAAAVLSEEGGIAVRNGLFCTHQYMARLLSRDAQSQSGGMTTGAVRASIGLYNNEADIDRLIEYVTRIRDRKWLGRYSVRGNSMDAQFAGRCADSWMESSAEIEPLDLSEIERDPGYYFEVLQPYGSCRSYLLADSESNAALLVDPLRHEVDHYLTLLEKRNLDLQLLIETHTHADHLSGSAELQRRTGAQLLMHEKSELPSVDRHLSDGDIVELGTIRIEALESPGHAKDSICLLLADRVLTGDSLMIGGCGRSDLSSGNPKSLFKTLTRLQALPDDTLVFPGHDYNARRASTIGHEKRSNPRFAKQNEAEFIAAMSQNDLPIPAEFSEIVAINKSGQDRA